MLIPKDHLKDTTEEILFQYFPQIYDELDKDKDKFYLEYFNTIHEKMTKAYYQSLLKSNMRYLRHHKWQNMIMSHYDGNAGALNFLMTLDTIPFKTSSSEEILSMIMSFGLKGSRIWVFYKDCCEQDYYKIEKIWMKWVSNEISARWILNHMQDNFGKRIEV